MGSSRDEFVEFVCERLAMLGEIRSTRMFSGFCLYCRDVPFALIARNALYLKADDETREDFESRGLERFQPLADRTTTLSYYLAPPEFFEDEEAAALWSRKALAAGRRAQAKKRKKK